MFGLLLKCNRVYNKYLSVALFIRKSYFYWKYGCCGERIAAAKEE